MIVWLKAWVNLEKKFALPFIGLESLALLFSRIYVSWAFLKAGLTKIQDWDTTLFLFEEEYVVPILPPELAAYLGTFGELFFPVFVIAGLFSRTFALGLFFVNIVAVVSLEEIAPAAFQQHVVWGLLLAAVVIWGSGKASVDQWLRSKFN